MRREEKNRKEGEGVVRRLKAELKIGDKTLHGDVDWCLQMCQ